MVDYSKATLLTHQDMAVEFFTIPLERSVTSDVRDCGLTIIDPDKGKGVNPSLPQLVKAMDKPCFFRLSSDTDGHYNGYPVPHEQRCSRRCRS